MRIVILVLSLKAVRKELNNYYHNSKWQSLAERVVSWANDTIAYRLGPNTVMSGCWIMNELHFDRSGGYESLVYVGRLAVTPQV